MTKHFYEKYDEFLEDDKINITFDEVLSYNSEEFKDWVIRLRKKVIYLWDKKGHPPTVGYTEEDMINQIEKLSTYPIEEFLQTDLETGKKDVIRNNSNIGNFVNAFFPNMMKTKITYGSDVSGAKSIYDFFKEDSLLDNFCTYANRHFKRDSFYHYSNPISVDDVLLENHVVSTPKAFFDWFKNNSEKDYGFWLCPVKDDKKYTGFNYELKNRKNLIIKKDEIEQYRTSLPSASLSNVNYEKSETYTIRWYKKGQKLFPIGLKAFRVSFSQMAVNFPPLTARFIYEKLLQKIRNKSVEKPTDNRYVIYDPSAGWGGRICGAFSINGNYNIHYIGTDPNPDNYVEEIHKTKYELVVEFIQKSKTKGLFDGGANSLAKHSCELFRRGSEQIHLEKQFQKWKGKIDIVFTSPPYFKKEVYSQDKNQSCHMYDDYENWKNGFLEPTLKTAYEYLKPGGYIAWNIADCVFAGKFLPLEKDSIEILEKLGMTLVHTYKMALGQMPGSNRFEETDQFEEQEENNLFGSKITKKQKLKGKMKNFCLVEEKQGKKQIYLKYEPIFIFHKKIDNL